MNKTRLSEKRYRDKLNKKIENMKKIMKNIIDSYKKQKSRQNYKRKKNMS